MDHHEAAAADIAGARIGYREREARRDGGINRVAATIENSGSDAGSALFLSRHHAAMRADRLRRCNCRRARQWRNLRGGERGEGEGNDSEKDSTHELYSARPRESGDPVAPGIDCIAGFPLSRE